MVGGFHAEGRWQDSQESVEAMWVVFLLVALVPLWHETQLPVMPE